MPTDLETLQGTWTIGDSRIVIKKNKFESLGMGAVYEGKVELDETKTPRTFDLIFTAGPEKGNRNLGIYKLKGDTWTICLATRGDKRPRKFTADGDAGIALQTFSRDASPSGRGRRRQAAGEGPSGPPTELEGEWLMVSAVFNGTPLADDMVKWCKRVTTGNLTTVLAGPQTMLKATFTLDPSKKPNAIDYVTNGKDQAGIYELSGETLRVCMAAPGKPRPGDFASKVGDGRNYTVWRFAK